jgi:hypothetical protein
MTTKQERLAFIDKMEKDYEEAYAAYDSVFPPDDPDVAAQYQENREIYKKWAAICRDIKTNINEAKE